MFYKHIQSCHIVSHIHNRQSFTFEFQSETPQGLFHLLTLVFAHESVVYMEGDDLVGSEGLVEEGGTYSRVDTTTHQHLWRGDTNIQCVNMNTDIYKLYADM